jgi:cytochrome c nitrite reductase small subunit
MKFLIKLLPHELWKLPLLILAGIFAGLIIFLFYSSKAYSYLSDSPEACVNCHIMASQYATWDHGSHRRYATCNDCHMPQDNLFNKYFFKARDGMRHAWMFTLRMEPQVILIHETGKGAVQQNCIRCHSSMLFDPKLTSSVMNQRVNVTGRPCWECHRDVPHGRVNSLSSTTNTRMPLNESVVPGWLRNINTVNYNIK